MSELNHVTDYDYFNHFRNKLEFKMQAQNHVLKQEFRLSICNFVYFQIVRLWRLPTLAVVQWSLGLMKTTPLKKNLAKVTLFSYHTTLNF